VRAALPRQLDQLPQVGREVVERHAPGRGLRPGLERPGPSQEDRERPGASPGLRPLDARQPVGVRALHGPRVVGAEGDHHHVRSQVRELAVAQQALEGRVSGDRRVDHAHAAGGVEVHQLLEHVGPGHARRQGPAGKAVAQGRDHPLARSALAYDLAAGGLVAVEVRVERPQEVRIEGGRRQAAGQVGMGSGTAIEPLVLRLCGEVVRGNKGRRHEPGQRLHEQPREQEPGRGPGRRPGRGAGHAA
jgi:hypothetical protein